MLSQCRHFHYIIVSIFNAAVPEALERTQSFKFFAVFTSKKCILKLLRYLPILAFSFYHHFTSLLTNSLDGKDSLAGCSFSIT